MSATDLQTYAFSDEREEQAHATLEKRPSIAMIRSLGESPHEHDRQSTLPWIQRRDAYAVHHGTKSRHAWASTFRQLDGCGQSSGARRWSMSVPRIDHMHRPSIRRFAACLHKGSKAVDARTCDHRDDWFPDREAISKIWPAGPADRPWTTMLSRSSCCHAYSGWCTPLVSLTAHVYRQSGPTQHGRLDRAQHLPGLSRHLSDVLSSSVTTR